MSTYKKITKHPQSGIYEKATYRDDYFGPHIYGVEFESDGKVYPIEIVERQQIYDFWVDDVLNAFRKFLPTNNEKKKWESEEEAIIDFLNMVQAEYTKRWADDPLTGHGATEKSVTVTRSKK